MYIKLVSIIFEFIFAFIVYLFAKNIASIKGRAAILIGIISLFIPTVIFNGAAFSQCDIIYTSAILLGLYFILKDKFRTSLWLTRISFCNKIANNILFSYNFVSIN